MDLIGKFEANPWPQQGSKKVVFILDARNAFEQSILQQWIAHYANAESPQAQQIVIALGDDRKSIGSPFLVAALSEPDNAIVAPLRIAWLPPESVITKAALSVSLRKSK